MAGYIRQSSFSDGDTITAALFNNEYNQILNAFSNTSGHAHDGTAAEGPVIGLIGDAGETAPNNKVLIDTTNNYIEFYVQVSSSPVQQLYIADGAIVPVTDNDIDLGTSSLEFKDAFFDGTVTSDAFAGPLTGDVTGNVSGSAATVTTAAQTNITSLGTLTALTVDNININGNTIKSNDSDGDLIFGGNDGGSAITALTLDMSDAGAASFNGNVTVPNLYVADDIIHSGDANTYMSWNADNLTIYNGGTNNLYMAAGESVFNDGSGDVDFRVESNGNANMLKVDAGNDRVTIGGAGGTAEFNVAKSVSLEQVALSSSGNAITWDADAAGNAFHVTTENTTIGKASNGTEGQIIMIEIEQGGTARTVAWHGDYEFAASTAPTVTATANKTDIFTFRYNGTVWHEIGRVQNMSKT